jgi:hypothetical protein
MRTRMTEFDAVRDALARLEPEIEEAETVPLLPVPMHVGR